MNEHDDREAIRAVVLGINAAWREKRYDDSGTRLDENVAVAVPGSDRRVRGRAPYVQSDEGWRGVWRTMNVEPAAG